MKPVKGGQGPVWAVAPLIIMLEYFEGILVFHRAKICTWHENVELSSVLVLEIRALQRSSLLCSLLREFEIVYTCPPSISLCTEKIFGDRAAKTMEYVDVLWRPATHFAFSAMGNR
jgi:hypothetical protein